MDKNITNGIRQVLMNELGFTRSEVREIMVDIVKIEVAKHIERLFNENRMPKIISDIIFKGLTYYEEENLKKGIIKQANLSIQKELQEKINEIASQIHITIG
jgi:hypothetical protein